MKDCIQASIDYLTDHWWTQRLRLLARRKRRARIPQATNKGRRVVVTAEAIRQMRAELRERKAVQA